MARCSPAARRPTRCAQVIAGLEFVRSGAAHVRITGQVALADEEFATVVEGAVVGLVGSVVLITLWLFLAVKTWRLIVPILATLGLGLMLTAAVRRRRGRHAQSGVRRVRRPVRRHCRGLRHPVLGALSRAALRVSRSGGGHAAERGAHAATRSSSPRWRHRPASSGFVPTDFSGVAELGLIAGIGMLIAFLCTMTFLPAVITLCRPPGEQAVVGFAWLAPFDPIMARHRRPILVAFIALAALAHRGLPRGWSSIPIRCTPRIPTPRRCGRCTT